ncbi:hypothetical protein [Bhargavaea cecembensis]|uniref:hypothetical protein n=1 Tax=Bhargavaea cecembensis TaxID=394098 RepID=UPI0015CF6517|nr:hypothetical protein [Bhargavaea cecembensis]
MHELVGTCEACGKDVFCQNGFLNGVSEGGKLLCFECADGDDRGDRPQSEEQK